MVSVMPRPLFTPGKTRYPLYRRLGGPQGRSGQVLKISPPYRGFDSRTVQPVSSVAILTELPGPQATEYRTEISLCLFGKQNPDSKVEQPTATQALSHLSYDGFSYVLY